MAISFKEEINRRQATKLDLLDVARALGVVSVDMLSTVGHIRAQIRARLLVLEATGKLDQ